MFFGGPLSKATSFKDSSAKKEIIKRETKYQQGENVFLINEDVKSSFIQAFGCQTTLVF